MSKLFPAGRRGIYATFRRVEARWAELSHEDHLKVIEFIDSLIVERASRRPRRMLTDKQIESLTRRTPTTQGDV